MSTITSLLDWITATLFRTTINTNFSNLNTDKVEWPASAVANNVVTFNWTTGKLIKDSGLALSGSNTGDQTSIVGITGTLAQFNTACTDANFASTDAANTFTGTQTINQIDFWNVDTSLTRSAAWQLAMEWVDILSTTNTKTLTNKRITKRVVTTTDDSTAVIDTDITDEYELSAMANATTFTVTGTPTDWQTLIIRLKDNGSARALTWTMSGGVIGVTLPTTTVISKWSIIWFKYFSSTSSWKAIAVSQEV